MNNLALKIFSRITDSIVIFDKLGNVVFNNLEKSRFKRIVVDRHIVDENIMRLATKIEEEETKIIELLGYGQHESDFQASLFMDNEMYCLHIIDKSAETKARVATNNIFELINHELRNPMQIFITGAALVSEELLERNSSKEDNEDFHLLVDMTIKIAEELANKMEKLSALALAHVADPINSNDRIQLVELVYSAIDSLSALSTSKGISINVIKKSGTIEVLYGSFVWLKHALKECIRNSIEHSCHNSEIHVELKQSGYFVHIVLRDFGRGVAPNLQPTLYEPFHRAHNKFDLSTQGLGIGLALAKKIIKSYGGNIKNIAIQGGVEFHIELPTGGAVRSDSDCTMKQTQLYAHDIALLMKRTHFSI